MRLALDLSIESDLQNTQKLVVSTRLVNLKNNLLPFLRCPICTRELTINTCKKINNEILEGHLICKKQHKFAITKGIPRFVVDTAKNFVKTQDAFSAKWRIYHNSYHKKNWFEFQRRWFLERFGWKTLSEFNKFLQTKRYILDAGTGLGNSAKFLSTNPKSMVFALDASGSIDFAYQKYGRLPNVHFLEADLRKLPFKKRSFDFIYSDQVLHHTKNTETSFNYLTKFLMHNAHISIYVYNKKAPIREFADDYIRSKTTKMSEIECVEFSKDMALLGKSLSKLKKSITIPRDIKLLNIKKGTYDVQRFIYWHFLKCFWAEDNDFQRSVGVNFDWYYPKYAYRHTPQEVRSWYNNSQIKITSFKEIESGISVTGIKQN